MTSGSGGAGNEGDIAKRGCTLRELHCSTASKLRVPPSRYKIGKPFFVAHFNLQREAAGRR